MSTVGGAMLVAQFILLFFIGRDYVRLLRYLGFVLWAGGCVLAWLPIFYFRHKAGVPKGKSYVHTTKLVTTGIYSVVRHPQYSSFFVLAFGLALIGRRWAFFLLGAVGSLVFALGLKGEDEATSRSSGTTAAGTRSRSPGTTSCSGSSGALRAVARRRGAACAAPRLR